MDRLVQKQGGNLKIKHRFSVAGSSEEEYFGPGSIDVVRHLNSKNSLNIMVASNYLY